MSTRPTAGPYRVEYGSIYCGPESMATCILRADRDEPRTMPTERDANVAFACRAMNSHYGLLAACEALVAQATKHSREWGQAASAHAFARDPETAKAFAAARAAIAQARGEKGQS